MRNERGDAWRGVAWVLMAAACACLLGACYSIEPSGQLNANAGTNANAAASGKNANARPTVAASPSETPTPAAPVNEATPQPGLTQGEAVPPAAIEPAASEAPAGGQMLIPVAGIRPEQLRDTYTESRSEGRVHNAIDIIAPRGTPVLAAADGPVVKLFQSVPGGVTIYQLSTDNRTILYYAHLERYADGLKEGHFARRGETIAYVGDTGNAGAGNYHLHFSVSITDDPKRWWGGTNVNPYPLLKGEQ